MDANDRMIMRRLEIEKKQKMLKKHGKWQEDLFEEPEELKDLSKLTPVQLILYEKHKKLFDAIKIQMTP